MYAVVVILWFLSIYFSMVFILHTGGSIGLMRMFPEAWSIKRFVYFYLSLAWFAAMVHFHPFK